jgi:hypothetical protein
MPVLSSRVWNSSKMQPLKIINQRAGVWHFQTFKHTLGLYILSDFVILTHSDIHFRDLGLWNFPTFTRTFRLTYFDYHLCTDTFGLWFCHFEIFGKDFRTWTCSDYTFKVTLSDFGIIGPPLSHWDYSNYHLRTGTFRLSFLDFLALTLSDFRLWQSQTFP